MNIEYSQFDGRKTIDSLELEGVTDLEFTIDNMDRQMMRVHIQETKDWVWIERLHDGKRCCVRLWDLYHVLEKLMESKPLN